VSIALLALVLIAAAIHVGWNAIARSLGGASSFPWVTAVVGALVLAPLFVWQRVHDPGPIGAQALALALLSGLIEAAYFLLLQASYGRAELSLVYPLSRGVAPLLALLPARLFAGETLSRRELLGVALILAGTVVVALARGRRGGAAGGRLGGVAFALLTGAAIAAYQLIDGIALRGGAPPRPLEYFFLMQIVLATTLTVGFALRGGFQRTLLVELRQHAGRLIGAGIAIQAAYLLILLALRDGKIPLVIAARNAGIPLSLLAGRLLLHERPTRRRVVAALAIVAGVVALVAW
jgi:drug/metabolite transporter (DMT)-like permease